MGQRPQQCPSLASLRQSGEVLADVNAWRRCLNGLELASYTVRRIWLEIKTFVLREAAGKKNIEDGLGCSRASARDPLICATQRFQMVRTQAD
jgi:hypothetical protein